MAHKEIIEQNMALLKAKISLKYTTLWDQLITKGIYTMADKDAVVDDKRVERDQTGEILKKIANETESTFDQFCECLIKAGQGHIVYDILKQDVDDTDQSLTRAADEEAAGPSSSKASVSRKQSPKKRKAASKSPPITRKERRVDLETEQVLEEKMFTWENIIANWAYKRYEPFLKLTEKRLKENESKRKNKPIIRIGIIDGGINLDHPIFNDFKIKVIDCTGEPVDSDTASDEKEQKMHGTKVASLVCAYLKNVKDYVKIQFYKIRGHGTIPGGYERYAEAYSKILTSPKEGYIICQSVGFQKPPPYGHSAKRNLAKVIEDHVLICAASNEGAWQNNTIHWPANKSIAIGSCERNGKPSSFCPQGHGLHVLAPGVKIDVADPEGDEFMSGHGTSFACPITVALYVHVLLQSHATMKDLVKSPNAERAMKTTEVAENLLRLIATNPSKHSSKEGYGVIKPQDALKEDDDLKSIVKKALEDSGF